MITHYIVFLSCIDGVFFRNDNIIYCQYNFAFPTYYTYSGVLGSLLESSVVGLDKVLQIRRFFLNTILAVFSSKVSFNKWENICKKENIVPSNSKTSIAIIIINEPARNHANL